MFLSVIWIRLALELLPSINREISHRKHTAAFFQVKLTMCFSFWLTKSRFVHLGQSHRSSSSSNHHSPKRWLLSILKLLGAFLRHQLPSWFRKWQGSQALNVTKSARSSELHRCGCDCDYVCKWIYRVGTTTFVLLCSLLNEIWSLSRQF